MASQISPTSTDSPHGVHQVPDCVHVQSHLVQVPLSPPPTVKKFTSIFLRSPSQDRSFQRRSRHCNFNSLLSFQGLRPVRLTCFYVLAILLALFCWCKSRSAQDLHGLKQRAHSLTKNLLLPPVLNDLHFIPASSEHIRVRACASLQKIEADRASMWVGGRPPQIVCEEIVAFQARGVWS